MDDVSIHCTLSVTSEYRKLGTSILTAALQLAVSVDVCHRCFPHRVKDVRVARRLHALPLNRYLLDQIHGRAY